MQYHIRLYRRVLTVACMLERFHGVCVRYPQD